MLPDEAYKRGFFPLCVIRIEFDYNSVIVADLTTLTIEDYINLLFFINKFHGLFGSNKLNRVKLAVFNGFVGVYWLAFGEPKVYNYELKGFESLQCKFGHFAKHMKVWFENIGYKI